ncbi:MAG: hypothetical protein KA310_18125, partial [Pseudomonadales bacterium]|nr:hypothetical protein [Pseudomonadales bacterium]
LPPRRLVPMNPPIDPHHSSSLQSFSETITHQREEKQNAAWLPLTQQGSGDLHRRDAAQA